MTTEEASELLKLFRLDGEELVRISTGDVVRGTMGAWGYLLVQVTWPSGARSTRAYHRIKFAVAHGYLPAMVDHRNGMRSDNRLCNLRAATPRENSRNRAGVSRGLPRGVVRKPTGKYAAMPWDGRKTRWLGQYPTIDEASDAVEAFLATSHGPFYRNTERNP